MQSVGQVKTQLAKGFKCVGEAHEQALRFLVCECLRKFSAQEDFMVLPWSGKDESQDTRTQSSMMRSNALS